MPEGQADTLANENLLLIAEHLATKADLQGWVSLLATKEELLATKEELSKLQYDIAELKTKVEGFESRLVVKLGGLMLGLVMAMTALLGFLISVN